MKKGLIKAGVLVVVFFAALIGFSLMTNQTNKDLTTDMANATLPMIDLYTGTQKINELHGYTVQMDASYMRDTITPVGTDMKVPATIQTFGTDVDAISYKIRSMDGKDLIAEAAITDYTENGGLISMQIPIQNLIKEGQEYNLILELKHKDKTYYYYTRILKSEDANVEPCVEFAQNFHEMTFDEEKSGGLSTYMEPDASADNSTLNRVTINSTLSQVTWNQFKGVPLSEPAVAVREIQGSYNVVTLSYVMTSTGDNGELEYYNVEEYYRIRYTASRIYLLNFERTMNQIFRGENDSFYDNSIQLGIRSGNIAYQSNENGSVVCFVQEGELWSYDENNDRLYQVFSFRGFEGIDDRENYDEHDIKIIDVDEAGSINFAVYGYMNRGEHEGEVGIGIYHFDSVANTVEEEAFLPSTQSYQVMKSNIGQLIYENEDNELFIMMEGTVYKIDLSTRETKQVVSGLSEDSYAVSDTNEFFAYIDGTDTNAATRVHVLDFSDGSDYTIDAGDGQYIRPLGFMQGDFIYGLARADQVMPDAAGTITFPMYRICIVDIGEGSHEVLKEYQKDGYFVSGVQLSDYTIYLDRLTYNGMAYVQADPDTIMNREGDVKKPVEIHETNTEQKETQYQLKLEEEMSDTSPKLLTPKQIVLEENRNISIELPKQGEKYYVYSGGEVCLATYSLPEAIGKANETMGVVIGDGQKYIWKRARKTNCPSLHVTIGDSDAAGSSIAQCISALLQSKVINLSVQELLNSGDTPKQVLEDSMQDCRILDLGGCSVEELLYYVSNGTPVFAMVNQSDAVLIVGYDANNIVYYDPAAGKNVSKPLEEAQAMFSEAGDTFLTYIE